LWAISWWLEPDGGVSTISEFAIFSFTITFLVMIAYWLLNWSASEPFTPNKWVTIFIAGLFIAYFFFVTVPTAPWALLILPILMGLVYMGLRRYNAQKEEGSFLESIAGEISIWKLSSILAIPAVGVLFYMLAIQLNLQWHTNWVLYLITTPLGFILFGASLYKSRSVESNHA
jgi:hypothetical protein